MVILSFVLAFLGVVTVTLAQAPGPGRITWWRSKWSPGGMQLTTNNRATDSVSATFYACFATGVAKGVVEVTFPEGFVIAASTTQSVSGRIVQIPNQTMEAGVDYAVTVTGVSTPASVGGYGPFAIRTRALAGGQQIDANLVFASVYITGDPAVFQSVAVSLVLPAGTKPSVNQSGLTLSYKLTLGVGLWRFDTFKLTIDSKWTVSPSASCSSSDITGKVNNFNGTVSQTPHSLQCVATAKTIGVSQYVYIYGLAVAEIDVSVADNKYVDLRVAGVTCPEAAYLPTAFSWSASTYRFGTTTKLETGSFAGGPELSPDKLTTATWTPTWGLSSIVSGMSLYMDLSLTVKNAVPSGGSLELQVSEDLSAVDSNWVVPGSNCYVVTYLSSSVLCTIVSASTLRLTALPALAAGTAVTIRNVVKITRTAGDTAGVKSAVTYQTSVLSNIQLDAGTDLAQFKVASGESKLSTFALEFHDSTDAKSATSNYAGGSGDYKQGAQFVIVGNPQGDFTTSTKLTVECPFQDAESAIQIPANTVYKYTSDAATTKIDMTAASPAAEVPVLSAGTATALGSLSFTGNVGALAGGMHLLALTVSTDTKFISLPRIESNLATAYECYAKAVTPDKPTQRAATRFFINAQQLTTKTWLVPCKDNIDGVPAQFRIQPAVFPIATSTATRTYYVEIQFSGDFAMSSNLPVTSVTTPDLAGALSYAVEFPHEKSVVSASTAKLYYASGNNYIAITGLPTLTLSPSDPLELWLPLGGMNGPVLPTIRAYYINPLDPRYKFITHEDYGASLTFDSPTPTAFAVSAAVGTSASQVNGDPSLSGLTVDLATTVDITVEHYLYFVFPPGFTWAVGKAAKSETAGVNYPTVKYFSSPSRQFAFPGAVINMKNAASAIPQLPIATSATGSVSLYGFVPTLGTGTGSVVAVVGPDLALKNCANVSTIPVTITPGKITALAVKPNSVKGLGPDGIDVQHTVSFTLSHGIPLGGSLSLVTSDKWQWTGCSSCAVDGLFPSSSSGAVACSYSTGTTTITGFADFSRNTTIAVSVNYYHLLPPEYVAGAAIKEFIVSITSYTGSQVIDELKDASGSAVALTAPSAPGNATFIALQATPNTVGAVGVSFSLRFSLTHSLPTCGSISLASPYSFRLPDALNNCFSRSLQFSNCQVVDGKLVLTLASGYKAGDAADLYLDSAFDLPPSAGQGSNGFTVFSSWGGFAVDYDTTVPKGNSIVLSEKPADITAVSPISFSPKNAGELANYEFSLKTAKEVVAGDQLWVLFPQQFDYFVGDAEVKFSSEPSKYYLDCYSPQFYGLMCSVAHRVVVAALTTSLPASKEMQLTIYAVNNPQSGASENFQVLLVSAKGEYKAINQSFGTVTATALPGNIDVKSLSISDRRLFRPSDYLWTLFFSTRLNTDSELRVQFPPEYDLSLADQKDFYPCNSTYQTAANRTAQQWNSAALCAIFGNEVRLPAPAASIDFSATTPVSLWLQGVSNAKWTPTRVDLGTDFDLTDKVIWPGTSVYSSKFAFFVYRTSHTSLQYSARSYHNMNSAYASLTMSGVKQVFVGSGNERILVYPGTQSADLYVNTGSAAAALSAKLLSFSATTSPSTPDAGKLKYTSVDGNWTIAQGNWRMQFRVAAAIDLPQGLYYLNWTMQEVRESGRTEDEYSCPSPTLIEVLPKSPQKYSFTVSSIPPVSLGRYSLPIKVSIANPPHKSVLIDIRLVTATSKLTINPSTLGFGPDAGERFFRVQVAKDYDLNSGRTVKLAFAIGDDDAYAYSIPSPMELTVVEAQSGVPPASILSWGLSKSSKTSIAAYPSTDQMGVIYYQVATAGKPVPSFSALKASVESLPQRNSTASRPVPSDSAPIETEPRSGETWTAFQRRVYRSHRDIVWIGSVSMTATSGTEKVTVEGLFAGTDYDIAGYVDNLNGEGTAPSIHKETFRTGETQDCQPFTVKFAGKLDMNWNEQVTKEVATAMGVNPLRLLGPTVTVGRRGLQSATSVLAYTLLALRNSDSQSPTEQSRLSNEALSSLSARLKAIGIPNALDSVTQTTTPVRQYPVWSQIPSVSVTEEDSLTVSLLASVVGTTCCLPLTEERSVTADDVLSGYSGSDPTCITTNPSQSTNELRVSNLTSAQAYYVYCSASDSYPLWTTPMREAPFALQATTLGLSQSSGPSDDSAAWVCATALWLLAVME